MQLEVSFDGRTQRRRKIKKRKDEKTNSDTARRTATTGAFGTLLYAPGSARVSPSPVIRSVIALSARSLCGRFFFFVVFFFRGANNASRSLSFTRLTRPTRPKSMKKKNVRSKLNRANGRKNPIGTSHLTPAMTATRAAVFGDAVVEGIHGNVKRS